MAARLDRTRFGIAVDWRGKSMDTKLGSKTYSYLNFPDTADEQATIVRQFLLATRGIFQDKDSNYLLASYNPRMIRENAVVGS